MSDFTERFDKGMAGITYFSTGFNPECSDCRDTHGFCCVHAAKAEEVPDEGHFSRSQCDVCSTRLAGNRYAAHGFIDGELCHFDVCMDCVMYHNNGDMPEGEN